MTLRALSVPFPGLAPVVDDWRERTCRTKPSHGVPPHVTLLLPAHGDVAAIAEALGGFESVEVEFSTVAQAELDEAEADLAPFLPLASEAESVVLYEQVQPTHWRELATFDL